ncbi:MAG: pyrroloquinoline quinone biosynthesis protein PqqB [Polyangiales bacterium]
MRILVLGSGAGGGLPQWNCGCPGCRAAREGHPEVTPRSQSSIAVSADGERWLLINASPDVRSQLAAAPALHPKALRHSPVEAVALSNADIDHCLGLVVLREGGAPPIYGTRRTERALREGLRILPVLGAYGAVQFRPVRLDEEIAFADREGRPLGVTGRAFAVASKPPPYMLPLLSGDEARDDLAGDTVAWVLRQGGGPSVVYVPGVKVLDERLRREVAASALTLIDGTFWRDDELTSLGASTKTARDMGHAPLDGAGGMTEFLESIPGPRKVLIHINNSNPILWERGEARASVEARGVAVSHDGLALEV